MTRQQLFKPQTSQKSCQAIAPNIPQQTPNQTPNHQTPTPQIQREVQADFSGLSHELGSPIQTKLTMGSPNDKYEREADRVAAQVVKQIHAPNISRSPEISASKEQPLQRKEELNVTPLNTSQLSSNQQIQKKGRPSSTVTSGLESSIQKAKGTGKKLPTSLQPKLENAFGTNFGGVRIHDNHAANQLSTSIQAKAFTTGQNIFFNKGEYQPASYKGQELIAHELTHVVQQNGNTINRKPETSDQNTLNISQSPDNVVQRKFGFEIEMPILATTIVNRSFGGTTFNRLPADGSIGGYTVGFANPTGKDWKLNVDHNQNLNPLARRELKKYIADQQLSETEAQKLDNAMDTLFGHKASILELVTEPFDEAALSRAAAKRKFAEIKNYANGLFQIVHNNRKRRLTGMHNPADNKRYIGATDDHAKKFQPKVGYFHATYGVKLSKIPELFEQSTLQKDNIRRHEQDFGPYLKHALALESLHSSIDKAEQAYTEIITAWEKSTVNISDNLSNSEKATFKGFITLLCNYLGMLTKKGTSNSENLLKQTVGMYYYKSDLAYVFHNLPDKIKNKLAIRQNAVDFIKSIAKALGVTPSDGIGLGDYWTVQKYIAQILLYRRGLTKKIKVDDGTNTGTLVDQIVRHNDVNGKQFWDPILAYSINPYSGMLGPEMVGGDNQELGVILENRHLEYLDPNYAQKEVSSHNKFRSERNKYSKPIRGMGRTKREALYDSAAARKIESPIKPINVWEKDMLKIYDMLRSLNCPERITTSEQRDIDRGR